ncbi:hypothetical protein [Oxalobacter paraformigenes]|uniref:Uncharacterized protein n=1 Tax=Oxalobacter paraformigenes TaxID=556268 RepID=T5LTC3_9BURK|nr:hypothetical protein [Oxalobacter paraformigenes]EQM95299.1 hypothetical protein OFAG_02130 [Oxalobacter paraformigenes]
MKEPVCKSGKGKVFLETDAGRTVFFLLQIGAAMLILAFSTPLLFFMIMIVNGRYGPAGAEKRPGSHSPVFITVLVVS